ncbi:MAG: hypothetical protein IKU15_09210 [Clostridia bacterium]|nr:hypothetical protein [Clostridia bacterium]
MDKIFEDNFNNIISYISPRIQMYLKKMSEPIIENIQEIRLRSDRPVVIVTPTGSSFLTLSGKTSCIYSSNCVISTENEIFDTVNKMCGYSMHSHYEDIINGYITLSNGSRVGLCGTAVYEKEQVKTIKDIKSINIRIPRTVIGVSEQIFNSVYNGRLKNLLIVGPPSSGKTTMLRDLAFQLSSGRMGKYYKICVVDERKELFSSQYDNKTLGPNTDVLLGFPKGKGISMAVRTLSPDVIICDEIGTLEEAHEVLNGANCGTKFALSIHADNLEELRNKRVVKEFLELNVIDKIVFLSDASNPCKINKIVDSDEVFNENIIDCHCYDGVHSNITNIYKAN